MRLYQQSKGDTYTSTTAADAAQESNVPSLGKKKKKNKKKKHQQLGQASDKNQIRPATETEGNGAAKQKTTKSELAQVLRNIAKARSKFSALDKESADPQNAQ